ncbi:MAG: MATE family efflux transporter [Lentisphaeria bacterium]
MKHASLMRNTLTNYLLVFVRLLQGVLVTRWTINVLGEVGYGLWAILWSVFAYSLLLDFGMGATVQKYTAIGLYETDLKRYNKVFSAIFVFYCIMSLIILIVSLIGSCFVPVLFNVHTPEMILYSRQAFLVFAVGTVLIFPNGIFKEILIGLQRIDIANYIQIVFRVIEMVGTFVVLFCSVFSVFLGGKKVISLTFVVLGCSALTNLVMAIYCYRVIPGFKFDRHIGFSIYKEIGNFSFFVYLMSISKLLLDRGSRLLVSFFYGLSGVGIFQISSRLSEFGWMASSQYQENISPIIAELFAQKKWEKLSKFIIQSVRLNLCFALFFMVPLSIFAETIMRFLFKINKPEVLSLTYLFIAGEFIVLVFRRPLRSYFLMADGHKKLAYVTIVEAVLNVVLNCIFLPICGMQIVLINFIVISLLFSIFPLLLPMLKILKIPFWKFFTLSYIYPLLIAIPGTFLGILFKIHLTGHWNDFSFLAVGGIITSGTFGILAFLFVLTTEERQTLFAKIRSLGGLIDGK